MRLKYKKAIETFLSCTFDKQKKETRIIGVTTNERNKLAVHAIGNNIVDKLNQIVFFFINLKRFSMFVQDQVKTSLCLSDIL